MKPLNAHHASCGILFKQVTPGKYLAVVTGPLETVIVTDRQTDRVTNYHAFHHDSSM